MPERVGHREEQIGLVGQADDVGGPRTVRRDPHLGAGVRLVLHGDVGGRAVADRHLGVVGRGQLRRSGPGT